MQVEISSCFYVLSSCLNKSLKNLFSVIKSAEIKLLFCFYKKIRCNMPVINTKIFSSFSFSAKNLILCFIFLAIMLVKEYKDSINPVLIDDSRCETFVMMRLDLKHQNKEIPKSTNSIYLKCKLSLLGKRVWRVQSTWAR